MHAASCRISRTWRCQTLLNDRPTDRWSAQPDWPLAMTNWPLSQWTIHGHPVATSNFRPPAWKSSRAPSSLFSRPSRFLIFCPHLLFSSLFLLFFSFSPKLFPLQLGLLNAARRSGERCELTSGVGRGGAPADNVFESISAPQKPHLVTLNFVFLLCKKYNSCTAGSAESV